MKKSKYGLIPEYWIWSGMKQRCLNSKVEAYPQYGGRGIKVSARWLNSFTNFYEDMGPRPSGLTLERKDSNKDYSPENCIWATRKTQSNNRRNNHKLTFKGKTLNLREWENFLGLGRAVLYHRLRKGWSLQRALTEKVRPMYLKYSLPNGTLRTIKEWSLITGISENILWGRLRNGWSLKKALSVLPDHVIKHESLVLQVQQQT